MATAFQRRHEWHDPVAYRHLLAMDRAGFAWEVLRRNPLYRSAVAASTDKPGPERLVPGAAIIGAADAVAAQRWGLLFPRRSR